MDILDFETWQKMECDRLGILVEQHNKIIEVSNNIEAVGLGSPYDFICNAISPPSKMAELAEAAVQVLTAKHLSPQKSKQPCGKKYTSKKFRRVHI